MIAEHIYEQIDYEGQVQRVMDEIVDHQRLADAVHADDSKSSDGKVR
jgi:hypothetical protein